MNDRHDRAYQNVTLEIDDPVALLRLDRPEKLNAFTYEMLGEIRHAIAAAADDPAVVGIVITGNGRGFCAGLDAQTLQAVTAEGGARRRSPAADDELPGLFTYFLEVPKPIIAAVNGVAAGGGRRPPASLPSSSSAGWSQSTARRGSCRAS
jgi:enoyl-CoA hydratase/carnithine racemase